MQQVEKLYSTQMLNTLKLLVASITRVHSEELSALIYPLIEILSIYEKISDAVEYTPLKLHLLEYMLTVM